MSQISSIVSPIDSHQQEGHAPTGAQLVATCGRTLPLRATRLQVRSKAGLATVKVVQTFANPYDEPLRVRYQLPLPADAAVGGFAFSVGARRIVGSIDRKHAARERFEQAVADGRTAALLEQDRSSLFSQELGNLLPGAEVVAEVELDQPLAWQDGGWQWRFPTTVAPRYQGQAGRVADAASQNVDVMAQPVLPRLQVDLFVRDELTTGAPTSPSHALQCSRSLDGTAVQVAGAPMDRDLVVRWQCAAPTTGVTLDLARPDKAANGSAAEDAYGLLTVVPEASPSATASLPRDLIVLLDISGSMSGHPLAAAQRVTAELIASLRDEDRLELVAFSSRSTAWHRKPVQATARHKAAAHKWLMSLRAGGGTEMRSAILQSLQPLRESAQRQVVLVTDGLIGFEQEIVATIRTELPQWSRVHVVGVGSAPNRSLTRSAARAGRGLEVLIGLGEDPAPAAARLLARTSMPLVTDLQVAGDAVRSVCPTAMPDLFAGAPVRLGLALRPEGGSVQVRGFTPHGAFQHELQVDPVAVGSGEPAVARLVGREQIEDIETELAGSPADCTALTQQIERIALGLQIASRATSWIAVDEQATVDPQAPKRFEQVPHELPFGMSVEGLGLREAQPVPGVRMRSGSGAAPAIAPMASMPSAQSAELDDEEAPSESLDLGDALADSFEDAPPLERPRAAPRRKEAQPPEPSRTAKSKRLRGRRQDAPSKPRAPYAVARQRSELQLAFDVFGLSNWQPPTTVWLVFADGRRIELVVSMDASTRAGELPAGTLAVLVARIPDGSPERLGGTPATQLVLGDGAAALTLAIRQASDA